MSQPSTSTSKDPVHRLVIYRPKPGKLADIEAIVSRHGPVLRRVGLITDDPVRVYRGTDLRKPDEVFVVEEFFWRDEASSDVAHQTPEVMAVWETMGAHLEDLTLITLDAI